MNHYLLMVSRIELDGSSQTEVDFPEPTLLINFFINQRSSWTYYLHSSDVEYDFILSREFDFRKYRLLKTFAKSEFSTVINRFNFFVSRVKLKSSTLRNPSLPSNLLVHSLFQTIQCIPLESPFEFHQNLATAFVSLWNILFLLLHKAF